MYQINPLGYGRFLPPFFCALRVGKAKLFLFFFHSSIRNIMIYTKIHFLLLLLLIFIFSPCKVIGSSLQWTVFPCSHLDHAPSLVYGITKLMNQYIFKVRNSNQAVTIRGGHRVSAREGRYFLRTKMCRN